MSKIFPVYVQKPVPAEIWAMFMHAKHLSENLKERDHLKDLGLERKYSKKRANLYLFLIT
jgi:hypothetical protein